MRRRLMLGAGLAACVAVPAKALTQSPAPAQAPRDLTIVDGVLPPAQQLIKTSRGDTVRWRLVSNRPGEVHVHAYRVSVALRPGLAAELAFTAHATGRFRVEWHAADGAANGGHHAPPLAVLEVRPR